MDAPELILFSRRKPPQIMKLAYRPPHVIIDAALGKEFTKRTLSDIHGIYLLTVPNCGIAPSKRHGRKGGIMN